VLPENKKSFLAAFSISIDLKNLEKYGGYGIIKMVLKYES
jgi:hypothetical protein